MQKTTNAGTAISKGYTLDIIGLLLSKPQRKKKVSYLRWQLELTSHHPASTLPQIRTQPFSKAPYLRTFEESRCTPLDVRLEEERGISDPQRYDTVHESNRFAGHAEDEAAVQAGDSLGISHSDIG